MTEREMGEGRHAFVEGSPFGCCLAPGKLPGSRYCGLPPDAEVHQAGRFISTEQPGELNAPPLPSTEKPAEAPCNCKGDERCWNCLENPKLRVAEKPIAERLSEASIRDSLLWAQDMVDCERGQRWPTCSHAPSEHLAARALLQLASPPPQAQPEETERSSSEVMQDDMTALMKVLGISTHARPCSPHEVMVSEIIPAVRALLAPPPAQPEGEPKRFGGMLEEEWLVALSTGRFDLRQAGDLIAAAFGERA